MVIADLRAYLAARIYGLGERLELERVLASRFGCSRETLRAALVALENEGLV